MVTWLAIAAFLVAACGGAPPQPTPSPAIPTITPTPVPTPRCVEPSLTVGAVRFRVQPLPRATNGSLAVPPERPGVAYWVEGTDIHYLFALSPSRENLALQDTVRVGDEVVITWADCLTDTYRVEAVGPRVPDLTVLTDQSSGGLTVYAGEPGGSGLLITAARPRVEAPEQPEELEEGAIQADMAFGETVVSPDGAQITVTVTITNTGPAALPVTTADFSLGPEGGEAQMPLRVEPVLPREIQPGAGMTFQITFAHPGPGARLLRILHLTIEQYY